MESPSSRKQRAGRILLGKELSAQARLISIELAVKCRHKPPSEINFFFVLNKFICCFSGKVTYITDTAFNPLLAYESTSYINACALSDTAKYMLIQTANNHFNDEDSGVSILIDVQAKAVLVKKHLPTDWKTVTRLFVDERSKSIYLYYGDINVKYSFDLEPDPASLDRYWQNIEKSSTNSPYALNQRAHELISKAVAGDVDWGAAEPEVVDILAKLSENKNMSQFQLSNTYRELGDFYSSQQNARKAVMAYEAGLKLNPKLPVKRKLNQEREKMKNQ